jgi:hypothetical protein
MSDFDPPKPVATTATRDYRRRSGTRIPSEAKNFAQGIITSPEYRESIKRRVKEGKLAAPIEQLLWYYAYGKPVDKIDLTMDDGRELEGMTTEELAEEARMLAAALRETSEAEATDEEELPAHKTVQ